MKRLIGLAGIVLWMSATTTLTAAEAASPLVWCGLDYSKVKMIGTTDFHKPEEIFPGMLNAWNGLFMKEMLPLLEKLDKKTETDLDAVNAANQKADKSQIEASDGTKAEKVDPSHITADDIAAMVKGYNLKHSDGMGLVFVMDRLVKAQEVGCLYVVFFDVASRKVIHSERVVAKAGGFGFRNFWFRPVKETVEKLPKTYKAVKAGK